MIHVTLNGLYEHVAALVLVALIVAAPFVAYSWGKSAGRSEAYDEYWGPWSEVAGGE